MACLSTALLRDDRAAPPEPREVFGPSATFTPLEWRVIELAARDGLATLNRPGMLRSLGRRLIGARVGRPLADPRLEILRCAAVSYWRTGAAAEQAQVEALIDAGYSLPQVALLSRSIGGRRGR